MENESKEPMEFDRDSPAAKNQRLDDSPTTEIGQVGPDVLTSGPEISDSQLDGQVDEDVDKQRAEVTSQKDVSVENLKIKVIESATLSETETEKSKTCATLTSTVDTSFERNSIYHVKWIGYRAADAIRRVGIVTQNENGPCPLLSIVNVLLLRGKLTLPEGCEVISAEQLLEFLGEFMISQKYKVVENQVL